MDGNSPGRVRAFVTHLPFGPLLVRLDLDETLSALAPSSFFSSKRRREHAKGEQNGLSSNLQEQERTEERAFFHPLPNPPTEYLRLATAAEPFVAREHGSGVPASRRGEIPRVFAFGVEDSQLLSSACRLRRRNLDPGRRPNNLPGASPSPSELIADHAGQAVGRHRSRRSVEITGVCLPTPHALVRAIRFATQPSLLQHHRLLLHASSAVLENGAHVFVAPSGTGKSTLARRLVKAGARLLGDEVALVGGGRAEVHPGQLLHGVPGDGAPLAAIHLLSRGPEQESRSAATPPLSTSVRPAQAMAELLEAAMVYEDGQGVAERVLAILDPIVSAVPILRTTVPNDDRALQLFAEVLPRGKR